MSALDTALDTIDEVAGEGDLAPARAVADPLELDRPASRSSCPTGGGSTRRDCTAGRSTSWPARCWTWTTRRGRRSCG